MTAPDAVFDQADVNHDGVLNQGEFRNLLKRNSTVNNDYSNLGGDGGYNTSGYRASSFESSTFGGGGGSGADAGYTGAAYGGAGYGSSAYESSTYRSSVGNFAEDASNINVVGATGRISGVDAASASYASASQASNVQQYQTDAQGNFRDANPQVIRRPAQGGQLTYTQNIRLRFLQPPAVPPPGPLIIKEVRPPQPPAPAPLRVRQQAPSLPTPPPLVLRERPPVAPAAVAAQTIVRNLAAIPVPPRTVVIERLPPAPAKPRDIIIERWVPYGARAKRKTIVQRAVAAKAYEKPRNVIIEYETPQVRVVRQFQRLGVTPENPQAYIQRYGASLFDAQTLLQQARAAGVLEDISPPTGSSAFAASASEFSRTSSADVFGYEGGNASVVDGGAIAGAGRVSRSSFYDSSSYNAGGDVGRGSGGFGGGLGSSSYENVSYTSSTGGLGGTADSLFATLDTNNDGVLSQAEFQNSGL